MIIRAILPEWAKKQDPSAKPVIEGDFTFEQGLELNAKHYNIYFLPNSPSLYDPNTTVSGIHIDTFSYVYVDMDLKENKYKSKEEFIETVLSFDLSPTSIVDSGNGIHVYWEVADLNAMDFLKLQRRLLRKFNTDEAVCKIYQLMRVPGTCNTKDPNNIKLCQQIYATEALYRCEDLDKVLPALTMADAQYCQRHFDKTYNTNVSDLKVDDKIPPKFGALINSNQEAKQIWAGDVDDRSKADYRLGHIMWGNGFTKDEARSVLVNSAKALERSPAHRITYAESIIEKIWTFEAAENKSSLSLSSSVREILEKGGSTLKGTRFPCHSYLDNTAHGFRLGQVIGLVAGSGVGKTAMALNMFEGFVRNNPDYVHFFVPLEQPANEIADRWRTMCGSNTQLHDKVHVISNYADDGSYRHLSLAEIREYLVAFQAETKRKVGCVVVDHIGALKKKSENGENQGIMDICHEMKAFAIQVDCLLVMQSQSNREKAGIGDLELNKDAAYGTVFFESYCDYLITMWQPLKRCYADPQCPTITAFKFCKIRHKKKEEDKIQEDVPYTLYFDSKTERMRPMTQTEEAALSYYNDIATKKRQKDRNKDLVTYTTITLEGTEGGVTDGAA